MSAAEDPAGPAAFGHFEFVPAERRLSLDGRPVALGSRAFDLLAALIARRDRVVPKDELIDVVWPGLVVEDNNLQVQISALRKVLGAPAIATVPGRGYRFTMASEAAPAHAAAHSAAAIAANVAMAAAPAAAGAAARLLVADDNKVNRLLLTRTLELQGHQVVAVENGRLALERLRAERFELLLLDLEMPELDGFAVLERRAEEPALREVPVIVTSSIEGVAQIARCIELGADDYLHKPVNPLLLKARVESSLERKHLRDRERALLERLAPGRPTAGQGALGLQGGKRTEATLLSARLHGLEALAAAQPVADTLELLDHWATLMCDAIASHGGRVHRMWGDGLGAVFGADGPLPSEGTPAQTNALAAVHAATEMMGMAAQFNAEREAAGRGRVAMAIGLASGEIVAGFAGTAQHAVFACVGAAVRVADELGAIAAAAGRHTLLDAATHAALAGRVATEAVRAGAWPARPEPGPLHALAAA